MYNFIDTIETASESALLPSEALQINGQFIENIIPGYRTLQVIGREALSAELSTFEIGSCDGSTVSNKRYPARYITIRYQLLAESNEAFRAAYNQLASILNVENAELIFNDETDKFFIGTPEEVGEIPGGQNSVIGEFNIYCADPFKYSVTEYEAEPSLDENSILIDYGGTHKAFPVLEAEFLNEDEADGELTGNGDCGFVAFFNEREKIIQLGNPDEADEEDYAKSQTLVSQNFKSETAWNALAQGNWATNGGKVSSDAWQQSGNVSIQTASYEVTTAASTSATLLTKTSKTEAPYVDYKVTAITSGRKANSVNVKVTITASLAKTSNFFGTKRELKGSIQFKGGEWHSVTIKSSSASWKGNSGHTVSLTVEVKDIEATTTLLEDIKFKVERTDDLGKTGILAETACKDLPIGAYTAPVPNTWYLMPETFGTSNGNWHGPSITRTIPADVAGEVGAKNFTLTYVQKMSIGNSSIATQERGAFQAQLISGSGSSRKIVAGVNVYKGSTGNKAKLRFYVNGKTKEDVEIDLSYHNKYFGNNSESKGITTVKTSTIKKTDGKIEFNIGGLKKTYTDNAIKDVLVKEITFMFARYKTNPALSYNGLYSAKFVKNNCDTWEDIPNKFSANDIVSADCKSGEIFLNNSPTPALGALGNDWEEFYLTPGLNQIGFAYSDWVEDEYAPKFKVKYREVFI